MSEKNAQELAFHIWNMQNELILDYGIDPVSRSFCINKDIDHNSFAEIDAKLNILERDAGPDSLPITIKINSCGGSIYDAWAVVSRIKRSPCTIKTEAYGAIMSAATMIFCAGAERSVSRYCEFMFHQASLGTEGTLSALQNILKSLAKEEDMYCKFLAENSKKSSNFWRKLLHSKKDVFLTAEQIIKLGIAKEIF